MLNPITWIQFIDRYFVETQDPRTYKYPLLCLSPWTLITVVLSYILLVKRLIPVLMKDQKPLQLRNLMFIYNTVMVVSNAFFFVYFVKKIDFGRTLIDFRYPPFSDHSKAVYSHVSMLYLYWMSKFADWLDTVFFAVRKKQDHISFLHLYHHTMVPILGWLFRMNPMVPALLLFGVINCFIHTVMYSYYALSSFGPKIRRFLWWKKYITQMQILQFVVYTIYALLLAVNQTGYPKFWFYFGCTQPPLFFYMFYDFYQKAYQRNQKKAVD